MAHLAIFSLGPHASTANSEALIARAMAASGTTVTTILCNGVMRRCGQDMIHGSTFPRLAQCLNCLSEARQVHEGTGAGASQFVMLDQLVDEADLADLYGTIDALHDDELLHFTAEGLPIGSWLQHSLRCEYKGDRWENLPAWPERARGWLKSTVALMQATQRFIARYRPTIVLVINGLPACEQALIAVSRRLGVRTLAYEGGQVPETLSVNDTEPACFYHFPRDWAAWRDVPLTTAEAAHVTTLLHFRSHQATWQNHVFSPTRQHDATALRQRLNLAPGRPLLVAFHNQAGDTATFAADVAFASHRHWLSACVHYAQEHPHVDLVIRVHPAEAMKFFGRDGTLIASRDGAVETLQESWPELPGNVRLVDGAAPISSYDLLAIADVALVYVSTIALEAVALGVPVVSAGRSHYSDTGVTRHVEQAERFATTIDEAVARQRAVATERERARRYLYFWMVRAPFPMLALQAERFDDPHQRWRQHWLRSRLISHLHGHEPFIAPPAPWRPRDEASPAESTERLTLLGSINWERPEVFCDRFMPALMASRIPLSLKLPVGNSDLAAAARRLAEALHRHGLPEQWPDIDLLPGEEATALPWLCHSHAWLVTDGYGDESVWLLAEQAGLPLLSNGTVLAEWLAKQLPPALVAGQAAGSHP